MNTGTSCYCGSQESYELCCEPFMTGHTSPDTATCTHAFTIHSLCHLSNRLHRRHNEGKAALGFDTKEAETWSQQVKFTHLEILDFTDNTVEFKAFYKHEGQASFIHENSLFKRIKGQWFYIDKVDSPKQERNQPCLCGSGKKYKLCCGQS